MAARKVRIKDVVFGMIGQQGRLLNISTNFGNFEEVRLCGTAISKFINDEATYGNFVLDDGSETIMAKFWRGDITRLDEIKKGDILDIIGTVGEYNGEIYVQPVNIFKTDINTFLKFHLEVALSIKQLREKGEWKDVIAPQLDSPDMPTTQTYEDDYNIPKSSPDHDLTESVEGSFEEDNIVFDDDEITRVVLESLSDKGISKEDIIQKTGLDEIDVMLSIKELLEGGEAFEVDGLYKRL